MLFLGIKSFLRRSIKPWKIDVFRFLSFSDHRSDSPGGEEDLRHAVTIEAGADILVLFARDFSDIRKTIVGVPHDYRIVSNIE